MAFGLLAADPLPGGQSLTISLGIAALGAIGTVGAAFLANRRKTGETDTGGMAALREERDRLILERDRAQDEADWLRAELYGRPREAPRVDLTRRRPYRP